MLRTTAVGSIAAAGVVPAVTTAQDDEGAEEIELGGQTSGWVGIAPESIADERNPTFELVEGEEYTVVWENQDGSSHNFIIEDEDGEEEFVNTDLVSSAGETQEVEFTAEEGMAEYFCGPHPTSMRGEIELVDEAGADEDDEDQEEYELTVTVEDDEGGPVEDATVTVERIGDEDDEDADEEDEDDGGDEDEDEDEIEFIDPEGDEEDEEDEDADAEEDEDAGEAIEEEIELGGQTSGWVGIAPESIADERNPTLTLIEGEEYTVVWENQDGSSHNFIIEDEDGEEEFVNTDLVSSAGETQEVEFTAEEEMAEYFCGPHPTSMRGEIELVDEADGDGEDDAFEEEAETDEDGVAEFDLADGDYEVSAQYDQDSAEDEVEIDGEDEEVTLELEEPTH